MMAAVTLLEVRDNKVVTSAEAVAAYLPSNYQVVGYTADGAVLVYGHDNAGWTADDYVIPRLASGLYSAKRIDA